MADVVTPGMQTSEYKMARLSSWVGIGMVVVGGIYDVAAEATKFFPNAHIVSVALIVTGALLKLGTTLGYNKGRVEIKKAELSLAEAAAEFGKP